MEWKMGSLASIMLSIIWEDKAFCQNNSKGACANCHMAANQYGGVN